MNRALRTTLRNVAEELITSKDKLRRVYSDLEDALIEAQEAEEGDEEQDPSEIEEELVTVQEYIDALETLAEDIQNTWPE